MTTLVSAWNSKLGHITDSPNNETVKTRCGRTLTAFHYGQGGMDDCPRCGSADDYEAIRAEMSQYYAAQQEQEQIQRENAKKRQAERLTTHRRLMAEFREMLFRAGANITEVKEWTAGGSFEFSIDGLAFELRGNIW